MKGGESVGSVYLRKPDPDFFRLCRVEQHKPRKRIDISGKELFSAWRLARRSDRENLPFLTGWMLLHEAEPEMRKMFRKISAKGARGISTNVKRSQYYLFRLVKKLHTPDRKEVGERTDEQKTKSAKRRSKADKRKGSIVMSILKEVAGPFKRLWGYDKEPPARDYYPLSTSDLQELEVSSDARVFMMSQLTSDRIDNKRYQLIQQEVRRLFPADAPVVIDALATSKIIESFAVIATPEVNGIGTVAIANDHGDWIRMESFKFCKLVESPDVALELGIIGDKRQAATEQPLAWGNKTSGRVIGKMLPSTHRLMIKVLDFKTDASLSTMEFLLDMDFTVLLVAVLQHLRLDAEQYQRWKEDAISVPARDPFANS